MPTKKNAKKSTTRKTAAKKTTAKKAVKKTAARKATTKKVAVKKAAVKKAAVKKTATKKAASGKAAAKKATKEKNGQSGKPKASDFIKRPSHTPAIFKPASKRPIHILFTMEDVRELLKKRAKEEKLHKAKGQNTRDNASQEVRNNSVIEESSVKNSKHVAASLEDILGLGAPGSSSKPGEGKIPRKFQKYYNLLVELRDHVRAELNLHSNDTLKRSQKEDAGDISISVDAGTDNFDRDFALSLLSSEQESLKEIEAAIQRIFNGTYGICEVTGEPIKEERLEAVPFTRFSVDGQRQFEMNARKRVTRTGAFLSEASGETISFGDDDGDN